MDGYRIEARLEKGHAVLLTRNGLDWTSRFPATAAAVAGLPVASAILDGEIVAEDADGISDFSRLQDLLKKARPIASSAISSTFSISTATISPRCRWSPARPCSPRFSKRRPHQLCAIASISTPMANASCNIFAGWAPKGWSRSGATRPIPPAAAATGSSRNAPIVRNSSSPASCRRQHRGKAIGSLVLGYYAAGELVYAGRAGTGFSSRMASDLYAELERDRLQQSPSRARSPPKRAAMSYG